MKLSAPKVILLSALVGAIAMPGWAAQDAPVDDIGDQGDAADKSDISFLRGGVLPRNSGIGDPVYDNDYHIQLKVNDSKCLSFDKSNNHVAKVEKCNNKKKGSQSWYYEHGSIKTRHANFNNWCLTYDTKHHERYLYLAPCHRGLNQEWRYNKNDYRFYTASDKNYCMDYCRDCGDFVHTRKCDKNHNHDQQYKLGKKFFHFNDRLSNRIYLKHKNDKCLTYDRHDNDYVKITQCYDEDDFFVGFNNQSWFYDNGFIKQHVQNSVKPWCLTYDIHHDDGYFRLSSCKGALSQRWIYSFDDYRFRSAYDKSQCIDHCRECGGYVHAKQCSDKADHDQEYKAGPKVF